MKLPKSLGEYFGVQLTSPNGDSRLIISQSVIDRKYNLHYNLTAGEDQIICAMRLPAYRVAAAKAQEHYARLEPQFRAVLDSMTMEMY